MKFKLFAVIVAMAMVAGCTSQKPGGKIENVVEASVTVTAVDLTQREIAFKDSEGSTVVVEVPAELRNLDQMRVGDEVVVTYTEALAWQVKPATKGAPGVSDNTSMASAKPGDRPGASAGRTIILTASITAIDLAKGTVTLTNADGISQTIKARDPANLKKVQVGDLVDITYSAALAVSVQPAKKK